MGEMKAIYSKTNSENYSLQCIPGHSSFSPDFNSCEHKEKMIHQFSLLLVWSWSVEVSHMVPHTIFPLL